MVLYLIGTQHSDLKGHERLEHVLNKLKPKTIFLEGSEAFFEKAKSFSNEYIEFCIQSLRQRGYSKIANQIQEFYTQIPNMFFELEVCRGRSEELVFLDRPESTEKILGGLRKIIYGWLSNMPNIDDLPEDKRKKILQTMSIKEFHQSTQETAEVFYDLVYLLFGQEDKRLEDVEEILGCYRGLLIGERDSDWEQIIRPRIEQ